ncbi:MAG: cytochrome c-type biogenesis protein [Anaerolineales bacterium]
MKRDRKWPLALAGALLFGLAWWAFARAELPTAPGNLDDEALEIGKMLQCPICQNLPVAYSPSQLAGQMREVIHKKLEAGESREQIIQYFVDRYGESILFEPPKRGFNLLAWRGPFVLVLVGAIGLYVLLRNWARSPAPPPPDDLPPVSEEEVAAYEARLTIALQETEDEEAVPQ